MTCGFRLSQFSRSGQKIRFLAVAVITRKGQKAVIACDLRFVATVRMRVQRAFLTLSDFERFSTSHPIHPSNPSEFIYLSPFGFTFINQFFFADCTLGLLNYGLHVCVFFAYLLLRAFP